MSRCAHVRGLGSPAKSRLLMPQAQDPGVAGALWGHAACEGTGDELTQGLTCADKLCCRGSLASDVQKNWLHPGGGDGVEPRRACDRRYSGAGPISGKEISTLTSLAYYAQIETAPMGAVYALRFRPKTS
jgi:hypothetical protein